MSGSRFESINTQDMPSPCARMHRSYLRLSSQIGRGAKMKELPLAKDKTIYPAIKINYCKEPIRLDKNTRTL